MVPGEKLLFTISLNWPVAFDGVVVSYSVILQISLILAQRDTFSQLDRKNVVGFSLTEDG